MDWHECVHPVVVLPLLELPRAENTEVDSWPIISMPLPEGPGTAVSVDYFGTLR